jgi:hypothetical protein
MDRALFDAVQQKLTEQWTTQSTVRNTSDHLLASRPNFKKVSLPELANPSRRPEKVQRYTVY